MRAQSFVDFVGIPHQKLTSLMNGKHSHYLLHASESTELHPKEPLKV